MSINYNHLRAFSDEVMPLVTAVLDSLPDRPFGDLSLAPEEMDRERCTDLVGTSGIRIAVRVRKRDRASFRDKLTIRSRVASGGRTELDKVADGGGPPFYFLGVSDWDGTGLAHWRLVDGAALARVVRRSALTENLNDDGTAFVEVDLVEHPELVLRAHDDFDVSARQAAREVQKRLQEIKRCTIS